MSDPPSSLLPGLYIVATPIGNLGDVSARAVATLAGAAIVLVEDTRVTGRLLRHLGVTARMQALHEHNEAATADALAVRCLTDAVALVSDAGTPLVSDPGYRLVRAARGAGAAVFTVPGPCAAVAALSVSGLPTDRFLFVGFLPAKAAARQSVLTELAGVRATLVFYESPHRLAGSLEAMADTLGDRPAAVCRELTKLYEETAAGTLSELAARYGETEARGEVVVVVGPPAPPPRADEADLDAALAALPPALPLKTAVATVAAQLGLPKREVYARALELRRGAVAL